MKTYIIEIGSHSMLCSLGKRNREGFIHYDGYTKSSSSGFAQYGVFHVESAIESINSVIEKYRKQYNRAGGVRNVVVCINDLFLSTYTQTFFVDINNRQVTDEDLSDVIQKAREKMLSSDQFVCHAIPVSWIINENQRAQDPRGIVCTKVSLSLLFFEINKSLFQNIYFCFKKCSLKLVRVLCSPLMHCSYFRFIDVDISRSLIVDIGHKSSSISFFNKKKNFHSVTLPFGGFNITNDIAECLSIPYDIAEIFKKKMSLLSIDDFFYDGSISIPSYTQGAEQQYQCSVNLISDVIFCRLQEMIRIIYSIYTRINENIVPSDVLLLGGGSRGNAFHSVCAQVFNSQVFQYHDKSYQDYGLPHSFVGISHYYYELYSRCLSDIACYANKSYNLE